MSLDKLKNLVFALTSLSCAICVGGLLIFESGSRQGLYSAVLAVVLLALAILSVLIWGRCPWCGKILIRGLYSLKVCPACKRDLYTGKKKKGKGGKK